MSVLARDLARAFDPVVMAHDCGIIPDPWQAALLRDRPRRSLLLCSRQSGKSTVTALMALWAALFETPSLIAIISPSQRQSAELFRSLMLFYGKLKDAPALRQESVLRAEFANGSRILALPANERTVRGLAAVDLLVIDEAARCENELLSATRPMLATSNGRLIALSTPFGKRGWFYEAYENGCNEWTRTRVSATECPRITEAFLAEELRELGQQRFNEEYGLCFLDPDEAVFPTAIIDAAFTESVVPLWN
jgi:hypothetical protein